MRALHLQIYYKLPNHDNIDKLNPALPSPKQKERPRREWGGESEGVNKVSARRGYVKWRQV